MKIYQKVQINFPCGYKVLARRSIIMGLLTAFMIKEWPRTSLPVCPLHGKKCKSMGVK